MEKKEYILNWVQYSREQQGDKKTFLNEQCKEVEENIEWERLEISSRKCSYQGNISSMSS